MQVIVRGRTRGNNYERRMTSAVEKGERELQTTYQHLAQE